MNWKHTVTLVLLSTVIAGWSPAVCAAPPQPATAAEISQMVAELGDAKQYDGHDVVYVLDEADVYVQKSGLATTESCQVIKILSESGVKSQSMQRFDFDPDTRRVTIKSIRVHHEDETTTDVPLSGLVTQPTQQHMIYWGGKQHLLGIPNLNVGDAIEIRVSKIGFNIAYLSNGSDIGGAETLQPPMEGHWYEVTLFQSSHPIIHKRYSVHMPKDMPLQYEVYNGSLESSLWFDGEYQVYSFTADDLPALEHEPRMVAPDDCVTKVVMATVPTWEMKSVWFHEVNEPQFEADDAIKAKVAEITAGLTSLEDKVAACNHWVADNVRYCGTSRGPREGFTLHRGIETFRDRAGVCKDKAGMLVTMLRVLGVEAYPALTMAGSRVEAIPADQFNHTVTVMRNEDGTFTILDPTWIPQSREMWSSREDLQGLVYGTPEGQPLTLSPYYAPDYNSLECRSTSAISESGELHCEISMQMKGYPCTYLRRNIARYPAPQVRSAFERALNIAPNAQLGSYSHIDPEDYSQDGFVKMSVTAPSYAAIGREIKLIRMPLMSHPLADWLIPDLFYTMKSKDRQYGYSLRATRGLHYEETITLPATWNVEKLPDGITRESSSATLEFAATIDGHELTYTMDFELKNHTIPASDYDDVRDILEEMHNLTDTWIVCTTSQDQFASAGNHTNMKQQEVSND